MNRFIKINGLRRVNSWQTKWSKVTNLNTNVRQQSNVSEQREESLIQDIPNPLNHEDFFGVHKLFTVRELFESRAHFGHKVGTLNPHMTRYLFGSRLGLLIFDLDETAQRLREALNVCAHIAYRGGVILFINRSQHTGHLVEKTAKECGEFSHCRDWKMGTFMDSTNYYGAVTRMPDLMIFISTLNNAFETHPAVIDAAKLLIPSVGIVDTNSDPTLITYPIPANDDTYCTVKFLCKLFKQSIFLGKSKRTEILKKYGTVDIDVKDN